MPYQKMVPPGGKYMRSKKRSSSNKMGKASFGPALSQAEAKKKKTMKTMKRGR